jgi:5-methylcytosine-specific restriction endonuclease McrA
LLTRDHILPRARGGKDVWANVVTACRHCKWAAARKRPRRLVPLALHRRRTPNLCRYT